MCGRQVDDEKACQGAGERGVIFWRGQGRDRCGPRRVRHILSILKPFRPSLLCHNRRPERSRQYQVDKLASGRRHSITSRAHLSTRERYGWRKINHPAVDLDTILKNIYLVFETRTRNRSSLEYQSKVGSNEAESYADQIVIGSILAFFSQSHAGKKKRKKG